MKWIQRDTRRDALQPDLFPVQWPLCFWRFRSEGRKGCTGRLIEVSYEQWLRFYTPLCSKGGAL